MNFLGSQNTPFLFILDFELVRCQIYPLSDIPEHIRYTTPETKILGSDADVSSQEVSLQSAKLKDPTFISKGMSAEEYEIAFKKVLHELEYGNTFLVNLTFPTKIETSLSLKDVFTISHAPYKLCVEDEFVVFSPETFVKIEQGLIKTYPMKGTIRKDVPDAENVLLENEKEKAEHDTIVDLLRNDLSMHAEKVHVSRYRYLDTIKTNKTDLLQMSSEIVGTLSSDYKSSIGDILIDMLPAGSVSGAPKAQTLKIISSVEGLPRGYYTGVFGVFDGEGLDSAVMIRFIEKRDEGLYFRSGCGITAMSKMEDEFGELLDKVYIPRG